MAGVKAKNPAEPEFHIKADYYEWSPYADKMVEMQMTNKAKPEGDDWQHVVLDFTTPKWGPFLNLTFVSKNCTAYGDDFCLAPVEEK